MDRSPIICPQTKESPTLAPTRQTVVMNHESTLVSSATGAGVLAGWAISSIGKKARNLAFVLRRPSYLPYQFAPTDMQATIPPAETLPLPCRARQNLQPAADRHRPYPMAANLKACSWVATRPARIPGSRGVEGWGVDGRQCRRGQQEYVFVSSSKSTTY